MGVVQSEGRKVFAQTTKGNIEVKYRLYELETSLQREGFVRFSKSILANIKHVKSFEMSFSGSMCAHFSNGMKEYVSRKYVPLIKEAHHFQTELIQSEARGEKIEITVLLIHAKGEYAACME